MAEIIVEPTALSKVIPLKFKINDVDVPKTTQLSTNKQFNTTDTDAWFSFELDGLASTNGTYDLTLINLDDKSIFHHDNVLFAALPFHYRLNSSEDITLNEIRHAGRWIGQLVVTMGNGDTTSRQFGFNISGHILDGQDAQVILLSDYQALVNTINLAKDDLAQYNVDYAALLVDIAAAEDARVTAYNQLLADQQANIEAFDVALDEGIVAANLATKLQDFEATNNSRLLSAEQQLADIAQISAGDFASDIAKTPNGGRLLLKNGGNYLMNGNIYIDKDITIDGNNAIITGDGKIFAKSNFTIQNTTFEKVTLQLESVGKTIKIVGNWFVNSADNAIESWSNHKTLIIEDNELEGSAISTEANKNLNNSGSFFYHGSGEIEFLRIKNNKGGRIGGGTAIFLTGSYPDFEISDNTLETMAQRGIGFWETEYAKGIVTRNKIIGCGLLNTKPTGTNNGVGAGVGCNAIYTNGNTQDVDVWENYIENVYENGIEGVFRSVKRNTIINTGIDLINYPTPSYEGVFIRSNSVVEDNTIINPKGNGIYCFYPSEGSEVHKNIEIRRNRITRESNEGGGICFRGKNTLEDVVIEDNRIDNFAYGIEKPPGGVHRLKVGRNHITNFQTYFAYAQGQGVNWFADTDGENVLMDGVFNEWTSPDTLTAWGKGNATLSRVEVKNKYNVHVLATDNYNGRITQKLYLPPKKKGRYFLLKITAKGNNPISIRLLPLLLDNTTTNSGTYSSTLSGVSDVDMKTFYIVTDYLGKAQLEICNSGLMGSWIEVSEVRGYLIDQSEL